jgi:hypothetical protein
MSTTTILQLTQAVGGLTGGEQLEAVQAGSSVRVSAGMIAALAAQIASTGPTTVIYGVPAAANNDYNVNGQMGAAVGFIDLTPTTICNISGLAAGFDGQIIVITNLSAFQMTLNSLSSNSQPQNRFRMAADFILTQNNGKSFKYSASIGLWVAL